MIKSKIFIYFIISCLVLIFCNFSIASKENPELVVQKVLCKCDKHSISQEEFNKLVELGSSGIDPLIKAATDNAENTNSRWIATRAVGKIGQNIYSDMADSKRAAKKESENYKKIQNFLLTMLTDPSPLQKIAASTALGDIGDQSCVDSLINLLEQNPPVLVKASVVDSLGILKNEKAVAPLEKQLYAKENFHRGKSLWVRVHVISALGQIQGPQVIEILQKASLDKDKEVSEEAKLQLAKIQGQS